MATGYDEGGTFLFFYKENTKIAPWGCPQQSRGDSQAPGAEGKIGGRFFGAATLLP